MGWMQSSDGVHIAVATVKVLSWMGLMQTNEGIHMGTDTIAIATTQCEQVLRARFHLMTKISFFCHFFYRHVRTVTLVTMQPFQICANDIKSLFCRRQVLSYRTHQRHYAHLFLYIFLSGVLTIIQYTYCTAYSLYWPECNEQIGLCKNNIYTYVELY